MVFLWKAKKICFFQRRLNRQINRCCIKYWIIENDFRHLKSTRFRFLDLLTKFNVLINFFSKFWNKLRIKVNVINLEYGDLELISNLLESRCEVWIGACVCVCGGGVGCVCLWSGGFIIGDALRSRFRDPCIRG